MELKMNNQNDMRSMVVLLNANINNMCNATNTEDVSKEFIEAKDRLVALFKFNVERTQR